MAEAGRREPKAAVAGEACCTADSVVAGSGAVISAVVASAAFTVAASVADFPKVLD